MPQYLITPLLSILGALIVAGIVGWIRRPRLAYLVPRLFTKSNISDQGQLAEITVFNRGFGNEEDVVLTLNPKLRYEIVGSTSRDYLFSDNKLTIPRIGSNKDITVILTIEGGGFSQTDIESCLSKATTGNGVNSLAEVPSSGQSKVAGVIVFIFLPLCIGGIIWGLDRILMPAELKKQAESAQVSAQNAEVDAASAADSASKAAANLDEILQKKTRDINGWKISSIYYLNPGPLLKDFQRGAISATVGAAIRHGSSDMVTVPVLVKNLSNDAIKYTVSMTSVESENDERTPSFERRVSDVFVAPNSMSTKQIKLIMSAKEIDPGKRTIWIELFIQNLNGDTLSAQKLIEAVEGG